MYSLKNLRLILKNLRFSIPWVKTLHAQLLAAFGTAFTIHYNTWYIIMEISLKSSVQHIFELVTINLIKVELIERKAMRKV